MYHCLWYHPGPPFLFFFLLFFSINLQTHTMLKCFFLMGRVSTKTQITRKSIGRIDNQMSSGIELKLVAIHRRDYYSLFFFPQVYVNQILSTECNTSPNICQDDSLKSVHDYHLLLRQHTSLHFFYYYTYGGFGKIVERRDNI